MKSTPKTVFALTLALAFATPAWAQTSVEDILQDMAAQGYSNVRVSRTLLGRTKIRATTSVREREVVVTRSGQVLKDETVATEMAVASGIKAHESPAPGGDTAESSIADVTPTALGDRIGLPDITPAGITVDGDKTLAGDTVDSISAVTGSSPNGPLGSGLDGLGGPATNGDKGP